MPAKNSSSKDKPANGEASRSSMRFTRITQWQQRALDKGRTPLPEAPGMRPWLQKQLSDGVAPTEALPVRTRLRTLAPAAAPAVAPDTTTVTTESSQLSSLATTGSAEPSSQTPLSSPPDDKPQSEEKEKRKSLTESKQEVQASGT
ncbi:hypothetical protein ACHAP5_003227 [Fusarium lateritium]